jgi:hypothetical protein
LLVVKDAFRRIRCLRRRRAQLHACLEILNIDYEKIAAARWMKMFLDETISLTESESLGATEKQEKARLRRKRKNAIKDKVKKYIQKCKRARAE